MDQLNRLDFAADLERFARFQLEREELGEWADALLFSRGAIRVSLRELEEFFEDYIGLLSRYQRPEGATRPDARTVLVRMVAFPVGTAGQTESEDTESEDIRHEDVTYDGK